MKSRSDLFSPMIFTLSFSGLNFFLPNGIFDNTVMDESRPHAREIKSWTAGMGMEKLPRRMSLTIAILFLVILNRCDPISPKEDFYVFPPDNPWNTDISEYPGHPDSQIFIDAIGKDKKLHPDFGTTWQGVPNGIPFVTVTARQPPVPVIFTLYPEESDPGPYPVPDNAPVEGGVSGQGDRHVIVVDRGHRMLYELYRAFKIPGGWEAGCGARWDLTSNALRPKYWTSADAAGLPIFPGLVRYEEIEEGEILHALRFTVSRTQRGFIHPARHFASSSDDPSLPPMGLRLRLRADFDLSGFSPANRIILRALKTYGMMVADNGGDWFLSGAPDPRWNDGDLGELKKVHGRDFEVVYTGEIER